MDGQFTATLIVLMAALGCGVILNWSIAALVLIGGVGLISRPLDLFLIIALTAAAATLVNYEGGHLTRDLGIITLMVLYGLFCLLVYASTGRWGIPRTRLTLALALMVLSTLVATVNGVVAGNSPRFIGIELFPTLALCVAPIVGGLRPCRTDLRFALWLFVVAGLVHFGLGLQAFAENRVRTGGIYFTEIPSMVALLLLNLMLYENSQRPRFVQLLLIGALLFHQLISFTRGYWLGLIVSVPFSCVLYARRGPGVAQRWAKVGRLLAVTIVLVTTAVLVFGYWFGWSDIFSTILTRFGSSLSVKSSQETASNIARLVEYQASVRYVAAAPWFGHGLGFTLLVHQPMYGITTSQWYVHESYLLTLLKQGLIGLLALFGVLIAAFVMSIRGSRNGSAEDAGWCAAAAACTLDMAVLALTGFSFASVNGCFLLAVLWGVAMSSGRPTRFALVWRSSQARFVRGRLDVPLVPTAAHVLPAPHPDES